MATDDRIRVLIADDHPVMRSGLVAALGSERDLLVVAEASHGGEAVEAYRRERPDVAIIDLRLPVLDGVAATSMIRREFPDARVVIISSFDTDEDIGRAFAAGASTYVLKDSPPSDLVRVVRQVHDGVAPVPPKIRASLDEELLREPLSSREREILRFIARGRSNPEIAAALSISENTVRFHVKTLFVKLGVDDRTRAVVVALKRGILRIDDTDDPA